MTTQVFWYNSSNNKTSVNRIIQQLNNWKNICHFEYEFQQINEGSTNVQ